ncbi:hypothetical protein D3C85_1836840 [compost metagenome]
MNKFRGKLVEHLEWQTGEVVPDHQLVLFFFPLRYFSKRSIQLLLSLQMGEGPSSFRHI